MDNGIKILLIVIGTISTFSGIGQQSVADFINIDQMESSRSIPMDPINSELIEFAPHLIGDGLLFIQGNTEKKRIKSKDNIFFRLMIAEGNPAEGFVQPRMLEGIHTEGIFDGPVCYIPDIETLVVTKNQHDVFKGEAFDEKKLGLYFYRYSSVDSSWVLKEEFVFNNKDYNICHPAWDENRNTLFFSSDMPGGFGELDLYKVNRKADGSWSNPQNLGININSERNDCFPNFYKDKFLFFSSNRNSGLGGLDIFASVLTEQGWLGSLVLPGDINSTSDDLGLVADSEGLQLYFSSTRDGGKGMDDLYKMTLESSIISSTAGYHQFTITSNSSNKPLKDVAIRFFKFQTGSIDIVGDSSVYQAINYEIDQGSVKGSNPVYTDQEGSILASLQPGDYILEAKKDKFHTANQLIQIGRQGQIFHYGMDTIICNEVILVIKDSNSGDLLGRTEVNLNENRKIIADEDGRISTCIHQGVPLLLNIQKKAYQPYDLKIEYDETSPGERIYISLRPEEIFVEELPVFSGEYTVLENILYEYDKFNLTNDAKEELDRLASHMIKYPSISIELSAHTDSRGGELYNQVLSDKRAEEAKKYLIVKGIDAFRIAAVGYGESRLKNACADNVKCSESQHALNRRTEVRVIAGPGN